MNARTVIDEVILRTVQQGWQCDVQTDEILDALRAAAGGADRVVLAWDATPCPNCDEHGMASGPHGAGWSRKRCHRCGGSGVDGYTVTLHTLEPTPDTFRPVDKDWVYLGPLFRLVAVSPEPPKAEPCPVGGHHMAKATEDACPACAVSPEPPKEPKP